MTRADCVLLPNLGAEEGDDWRGYTRDSPVRVAARLWALLFSKTAALRSPSSQPEDEAMVWVDLPVGDLWPPSLGAAPAQAVYPWIQPPDSLVPWLRTASLDAQAGREEARRMSGPEPQIVAHVHDKAFAVEAARALELLPESLSDLISVVEAETFESPASLLESLSARLASWPAWTEGRFTLKPRSGSSGRGRVAGIGILDTAAIRGALPRLAQSGGAIFEPWLEREVDLSVCLYIPEPGSGETLPTLLGSLELLVTPSGVYRGSSRAIAKTRTFVPRPRASLSGRARRVFSDPAAWMHSSTAKQIASGCDRRWSSTRAPQWGWSPWDCCGEPDRSGLLSWRSSQGIAALFCLRCFPRSRARLQVASWRRLAPTRTRSG